MMKSYLRRTIAWILIFSMLLPSAGVYADDLDGGIEITEQEQEWRTVDGSEVDGIAGRSYKVMFVKSLPYTHVLDERPTSGKFKVIDAVYKETSTTERKKITEWVDKTVIDVPGHYETLTTYVNEEVRYVSGYTTKTISLGYYKNTYKNILEKVEIKPASTKTIEKLVTPAYYKSNYETVLEKVEVSPAKTTTIETKVKDGYYKINYTNKLVKVEVKPARPGTEEYIIKAGYFKRVREMDPATMSFKYVKKWIPPVKGTRPVQLPAEYEYVQERVETSRTWIPPKYTYETVTTPAVYDYVQKRVEVSKTRIPAKYEYETVTTPAVYDYVQKRVIDTQTWIPPKTERVPIYMTKTVPKAVSTRAWVGDTYKTKKVEVFVGYKDVVKVEKELVTPEKYEVTIEGTWDIVKSSAQLIKTNDEKKMESLEKLLSKGHNENLVGEIDNLLQQSIDEKCSNEVIHAIETKRSEVADSVIRGRLPEDDNWHTLELVLNQAKELNVSQSLIETITARLEEAKKNDPQLKLIDDLKKRYEEAEYYHELLSLKEDLESYKIEELDDLLKDVIAKYEPKEKRRQYIENVLKQDPNNIVLYNKYKDEIDLEQFDVISPFHKMSDLDYVNHCLMKVGLPKTDSDEEPAGYDKSPENRRFYNSELVRLLDEYSDDKDSAVYQLISSQTYYYRYDFNETSVLRIYDLPVNDSKYYPCLPGEYVEYDKPDPEKSIKLTSDQIHVLSTRIEPSQYMVAEHNDLEVLGTFEIYEGEFYFVLDKFNDGRISDYLPIEHVYGVDYYNKLILPKPSFDFGILGGLFLGFGKAIKDEVVDMATLAYDVVTNPGEVFKSAWGLVKGVLGGIYKGFTLTNKLASGEITLEDAQEIFDTLTSVANTIKKELEGFSMKDLGELIGYIMGTLTFDAIAGGMVVTAAKNLGPVGSFMKVVSNFSNNVKAAVLDGMATLGNKLGKFFNKTPNVSALENAIDAMDKVEDRFSNFDGYIDQNLENLLDASGELIEKNRNEFINALKTAELTSDEICDVVRKVAANDAIDTNHFLQGFSNDEIEDLIKRIDNTDGVSKDVIDDLIVSKYSLCFEAGTLVTTQRGLVAIENIQVGDQVLSRNMLTGENEFKPVLQTFVNEKNEFIRVHVNGEVIKATPEHPFYVVGSGFTQASNLQEGMTLMLSTGEYVIIDQLENDLKDQLVNTYNFSVKDNNNYYVGSQGLLVHNLCSIEDLTSDKIKIDADWYRDFDALMEKGEIKKEHIDAIREKLDGKVGADFDKVMDQLDILEGASNLVANISDDMGQKILYGARKAEGKNALIGGHSAKLLDNPNVASEILRSNPDGTKFVQFTTQFADGSLSKLKKSTLFPESWTDDAILQAVKQVGETPSIGKRVSDGVTLHRGFVNGVQVEVMKVGDAVTSGYPTGGVITDLLAGFE